MIQLSIIIVTFNNEKEIGNCLKSIAYIAFCDNISVEIIIVDNNSTDTTIDTIERYLSGKKDGINIRLIKNNDNLGFAKANNQALKAARGNIYWLLNPDTIIPDNFNIHSLLKIFKINNIGIIGISLLNIDGTKQVSYLKFLTPFVIFLNWTVLGKIINKIGVFDYWKSQDYSIPEIDSGLPYVKVDYVSGASMFIKREVFSDIGLFNEMSFMFCDDDEICFRAHKKGWEVVAVKHVNIFHIGGASYKSDIHGNLHQVYIKSYLSRIFFSKLHFSYINVLLIKAIIVQDMVIRSILAIFRGQRYKKYILNYIDILKVVWKY